MESSVAREADEDIWHCFNSQIYTPYCAANCGLVELFCISHRVQEASTSKKAQGHTNHLLNTALSAWLRAVRCLILRPSSLHRYQMPSAENLYLSYRWSSGKASGSNWSLKTLSRLKALLSTSASSSTTSSKNGHAIVRAGRNTPFWVFI